MAPERLVRRRGGVALTTGPDALRTLTLNLLDAALTCHLRAGLDELADLDGLPRALDRTRAALDAVETAMPAAAGPTTEGERPCIAH